MTEMQNLRLGDVQKTLFLPLWGRVVESKKKHPLLIDQTAVVIIEKAAYDYQKLTESIDELTQIAWIRRSLICDQVVRQFLGKFPQGTVVNIGCGLDTTYERTDNGKVRWYDLDLPDVIALRSKFILENDRRTFIASSFLESKWLDQIESDKGILFIAAGVFYYFEAQEIKAFFLRLIERFPGSEILFDVSSPIGVKVANKKVIESSGLDEKSYLKWGLNDKKEILAWDQKIRLIGVYYYYRTLRMRLRNILIGALSDFLGIQYLLHLGIEKA
jgi:O-methyltransferase involved in polyketide biosynthesis